MVHPETLEYLKDCLMRVINNSEIQAKYVMASTGLEIAENLL